MPDLGDLTARLRIDTSSLKVAEGQVSGFGSTLKGVLGALGLAVATQQVISFGKSAVSAYDAHQQALLALQQSFAKTPGLVHASTQPFVDLAGAISQTTTFTENDALAAESHLAIYNLNAAQLRQLTPLVADYAQRTGTDMATAADRVGKALLGKGRALADVGIKFKDLKDPMKNYQEVVTGLQQKVAGFADVVGQTSTGRLAEFGHRFDDLKVTIGGFIQGALIALVTAFDWLQQHMDVIGPIVLGLAVGFGVFAAALAIQSLIEGVTGAVAALNVVLAANPFILVALAIAALVAGLVVAYTKVGWFRDFVNAAFGVIKTVIVTAISIVIAIIHGIITAVEAVVSWSGWGVFGTVLGIALTPWKIAISIVVGAIGAIVGALQAVFSWSGWGTIGGVFAGAFNWIKDNVIGPLVNAIEGAVGAVQHLLDLIHSLPGGGTSPTPKNPLGLPKDIFGNTPFGSALGGPVAANIPRWVGERGPEIFTPSVPGYITPNNMLSTGGGVNLTVYVTQSNATAEDIAAAISWKLRTAA